MNVRALMLVAAVFAAAIGVFVVATRQKEGARPPQTADVLPTGLFLEAEPPGAGEIAAIKKNAAVGDRVVVRGRIGGSREPFVEGRAVFLAMDSGVPDCRANHNEGCPTPWDYCCAPREDKLAGAATVQVGNGGDVPLKAALKDVHGLKPLAEVVVVGRVLSKDGGFVIGADGIYVRNGA